MTVAIDSALVLIRAARLSGVTAVSYTHLAVYKRQVRYGGDVGRPIVIGAPDSEHAKIFMETGQRVAEGVMKIVLSGPRRPAGLVQVK